MLTPRAHSLLERSAFTFVREIEKYLFEGIYCLCTKIYILFTGTI